jgi:hypothetical protein
MQCTAILKELRPLSKPKAVEGMAQSMELHWRAPTACQSQTREFTSRLKRRKRHSLEFSVRNMKVTVPRLACSSPEFSKDDNKYYCPLCFFRGSFSRNKSEMLSAYYFIYRLVIILQGMSLSYRLKCNDTFIHV